ncbi:MAG: hypothetical protein QM774_06805 [Gordonia sp. (in: high G+C Gram-positive bacteria)]|uniref:hypothetical protein n=1 Tax=Gordonia sp. (in: high G+C Gram-positive bacteria) TaxID=84139 RepID=UPI0039E611E7
MSSSSIDDDLRRLRAARRERRGLPPDDDIVRIATSGSTQIWHTEQTSSSEPPRDVPYCDFTPLFRGFAIAQLADVLTSGIDTPRGVPFFARVVDLSKPWEFPLGRTEPAVAVYDSALAVRSFVRAPEGAGDSWRPDLQRYPHRNGDLCTMFDMNAPLHFPGSVTDEELYGFAFDGDPRDALVHVYLGGRRDEVLARLQDLDLPPRFRIALD